ncbi:ComF family protein [Microbulbifer bruguierae]|uniref:ComF family protein n=1 Tax=Microbulbifer bruguierae TaxID=3029061 RepID=A0ABY8N9U5_9GAMM|nr:ComF family protein [Microbulbifer bruguierae]WGL15675.1 ComF family protein [Microbulbifer bruguierae]
MLSQLGRLLERLERQLEQQLCRCLLCSARINGSDIDGNDDVSAGICAPCHRDLPSIDHACQRCALPLINRAERECPRCLQQPPSHQYSHACWVYAYPVAQLIQRFKYQRDFAPGRTLAELAASRLRPQESLPDLLVPVPLHWRRQLGRGYNQAQLVADIFGRHWRIPVAPGALRKNSATGSQQGLRRAERLKNLARSFTAGPRVRGLHVGLVDDVITTGATLEAATQSLLAAGARQVSVFALARTP